MEIEHADNTREPRNTEDRVSDRPKIAAAVFELRQFLLRDEVQLTVAVTHQRRFTHT